MKKQIIFNTIFLILSVIKIYSQQIVDINTYENCTDGCNDNKYYKDLNNSYNKFIGVWENTTGNMTFRVTINKKEFVKNTLATNSYADEIVLKYIMIKDKGLSSETIVYRSDKNYLNSNQPWWEVYRGRATNGNMFGNIIFDNCIPANPQRTYIMGRLRFELNTSTNPVTAHWTVRRFSGLRLPMNRILQFLRISF